MPMVVLKKRPTLFICLPEQEPENNLTEYLAAKGFGMRRIRDSGHAVDEIVTRVPDLVLLDSHLAPAGGFEVCRAVRSFYRGPILLLGDDRDEAPQLLAFACGSSWGELVVDAARREVFLAGQPVDLTTVQYELLWYLVQRSGRVVSRDELYRALYRQEYNGFDRSLDVYISVSASSWATAPKTPPT